ncbi:TrkH family potassium uptake protein [Vallitalea okinawensis]|uniref:TrkH family potassium uptake protein n=1 Tax=Vallitalea okinawensis TaxID=2078660 RepID=UPI000CFAC61A|nr:TrkH family potassium uptake protein [Vallitalea okinawensis]
MIYYLGNLRSRIRFQIRPTQILVLGFLVIIILGAFLLNLPVASKEGHSIGFLDALFTSTSAVCVTGLVVVNTFEHWSMFGKTIILILIQIGGLGFMTLTTAFFIIMGRRITLKERLVIQEALNQYNLSGMVKLVRSVVIGTFLVESIGALFLAFRFVPEYGVATGLFYSIFHSISAFCNAGFDIIGSSLTPYYNDFLVNITVMALIILGGLGFTVWINILQNNKRRRERGLTFRESVYKLSLHTKLVLVISISLILIGWGFFFIAEFGNPSTLGDMSLYEKLIASLFQSVTTRTAGFNSMDLAEMNDASKFVTILFMFIGGSPAGTAGGVKTVTIGIILLTIISTVRGKERTEAFNRTIPEGVIRKAIAVVVISLGVVVLVTTLLSLSENAEFMDVFFEAMSAFGTVGLSLGLTSELTSFGKLVVMVTMFIGRLGPITMALAFTMRGRRANNNIKKPEERVMVG